MNKSVYKRLGKVLSIVMLAIMMFSLSGCSWQNVFNSKVQINADSFDGKTFPFVHINISEDDEITKGTYDLGFISLPVEYDEKDLEEALEKNITRFHCQLVVSCRFSKSSEISESSVQVCKVTAFW